MVYDGDCHFCTRWIERWKQITGGAVDYLPLQDPEIARRFPEIPREQFQKSVRLIEANGRVCAAAEAVFRALACARWHRWPLWLYCNLPGFAPVTETSYRFIAEHRGMASTFTRLLWGGQVERPGYVAVRWLFLRALGIIYLIAFASLWTQVEGLIGQNGILPIRQAVSGWEREADAYAVGADRYRVLPTLSWWNTSDAFLNAQCALGAALSLLVILGVSPAVCLLLLWLLYLSLTTACGIFLGYQWDNLLLETGFLAILLAPIRLWPNWGREWPPSRVAVGLLRWLLFRLMFMSGCVKLLSGDLAWADLSALTLHYETQPLPSWLAWYAHRLPPWFHSTSAVLMFAIEIALPFFIFFPRHPRFVACGAFILFQLAIQLTGNYCFFNLLTIALCLVLLDDAAVCRLVPRRWRSRLQNKLKATPDSSATVRTGSNENGISRFPLERSRTVSLALLACFIVPVSFTLLLFQFRVQWPWLRPLAGAYRWISPARSVNNYGLFAVMTTTRPEILIEGSLDGREWRSYEFKYKPGDLKERPRFVAPHQPRVDWQMWFAALGTYRENPWFLNFCQRLLEGSPEVLGLLEKNPFPESPPRYIRAPVYQYKFSSPKVRQATGEWWEREFKEYYCPTLSLQRSDAGN